jgi:hypothetical protein
MPKLKDKNNVTWDVKTTSVTTDPGATTNAWLANVEDEELDYSGNRFALVDQKTFDGKGGTTVTINWPASGNPTMKGAGGEADAKLAIDAFAARDLAKPQNQRAIIIKVTGAKPGTEGSLLPLLLLVAVIYFSDK